MSVDGLTLGPGISGDARLANRAALSAAAAAGPLVMPAGIIEVGYDQSIAVTNPSVTGDGRDRTILDVYPKSLEPGSRTGLFNVTPLEIDPVFQGFTIHGPTEANPVSGESPNGAGIAYGGSTTQGDMFVRDVKITGLFVNGVVKSGKGELRCVGYDFNAWEAPVAHFQSTWQQGTARLVLIDGVHSGFGGEVGSSIGIYVHPHIPVLGYRVRFDTFSRYAIYHNGSQAHPVHSVFAACEFHDTAMVYQSHPVIEDTFTGCTFTRSITDEGSGSVMRAKVNVIDCTIQGRGMTPYLEYDTWKEFRGSSLLNTPIGGSTGPHRVRFDTCDLTVTGTFRAMQFGGTWNGVVECHDTHIHDQSAGTHPLIQMTSGAGTLDVRGGLTIHTTRTLESVLAQINATVLGTIEIVAP